MISVAVTTHGEPTYLRECLGSIAKQTLLPDEVVVSEDGDNPETARIVAELQSTLPLRHLRNVPPLGERPNRRQALAATRGDLLAMLDGDDEWEPGFLETGSRALDAHPECGFFAADHWLIDAGGQVLHAASDASSRRFGRDVMTDGVYDDVLLRHLTRTSFSLNTALFRRGALESIGFVPGGDDGSAPDFSLFTELGTQRVRAYYDSRRLGRYRTHPDQTTRNRVLMASSVLAVLDGLGRHSDLSTEERAVLARRFRTQVVELAIAYAHAGRRRDAGKTLHRYARLGWGLPPAHRLGVLAALLLGLRRGSRANS